MSVPHENLTKFTLLVQRSHQAPIDYHAKLFPLHFIHQTKYTRSKSRYDYESAKHYQALFMKGKQNISSLHKIICSLVSLLLYIIKVLAVFKVSSVFNHISPSFL